jgi:hypothetical protein
MVKEVIEMKAIVATKFGSEEVLKLNEKFGAHAEYKCLPEDVVIQVAHA